MPNEKEGKAGDSLKIDVSDDGQVTLDWDPNDPQWGWLSKCSDEQLQEFVNNAIKLATTQDVTDSDNDGGDRVDLIEDL